MSQPQSAPDMTGKVCIVTGGNSGIGKEAAKGLVALGAAVVIICRDKSKGEAALSEIRSAGNGSAELIVADISSLAQVRAAADEFGRTRSRLDVLVNNAGVILTKRLVSPEGYEKTLATNHLGHFLLTNLMLNTLKKSAPSRIINVSSEAHRGARIDFEDIQGEKQYSTYKAYSQSKLANVLFSYELARRLEGTGITVNSIHPGVVRTGFGHDTGGMLSAVIHIGSPFFMSAKRSAKAIVYLASSPEVATVTGKYFSKSKVGKSSKESYDEEAAKRLWDVSEELTGLPFRP